MAENTDYTMEADITMEAVTFKIKVTNLVNPSTNTIYENVKAVEGENLCKAMCTLEKTPGSGFNFESKEVSQHLNQHFIKSINGLHEDPKKSLYWAICKGDLTNRMPQSVDSIQPKKDEKYIFAYTNTPGGHDVAMRGRKVTFTIEVVNLLDSSQRVYDSVKAVEGENLYKAMCTLEKTPGSGFTFESKEVKKHLNHHFIAEINDVSEDLKKSLYWAICKGNLTNRMPQSVDFIYPKKGEKYIFAYTKTPEEHGNKA